MSDDDGVLAPAPPPPAGLNRPSPQQRSTPMIKLPIPGLTANPRPTHPGSSTPPPPKSAATPATPHSETHTGDASTRAPQPGSSPDPAHRTDPATGDTAGRTAGGKTGEHNTADVAPDADTDTDTDTGSLDHHQPVPPPGIDPSRIAGLITPAAASALGVPAEILGTGLAMLEPLAAMLGLFGQPNPAMPTGAGGLPPAVLDRLGSINPGDAVSGLLGSNYANHIDDQNRQARALDHLDTELRGTLKASAANSTLGQQKISNIIDQVNTAIRGLGPVANTVAGRLGIIGAITSALSQAGAVVAQGLNNDSLNAAKVTSMANNYRHELAAAPSAHTTDLSSQRAIAAAIISQARRRGYSPEQTIAILSTALQESGLRPNAVGGGGAWVGIFQQDKGYPGRWEPEQ